MTLVVGCGVSTEDVDIDATVEAIMDSIPTPRLWPSTEYDSAIELTRNGIKYIEEDRYDLANESFTAAIESNDDFFDAYLLRAFSNYVELGRVVGEINDIKEIGSEWVKMAPNIIEDTTIYIENKNEKVARILPEIIMANRGYGPSSYIQLGIATAYEMRAFMYFPILCIAGFQDLIYRTNYDEFIHPRRIQATEDTCNESFDKAQLDLNKAEQYIDFGSSTTWQDVDNLRGYIDEKKTQVQQILFPR